MKNLILRSMSCPDAPIKPDILNDFIGGKFEVYQSEIIKDGYPECYIKTMEDGKSDFGCLIKCEMIFDGDNLIIKGFKPQNHHSDFIRINLEFDTTTKVV